MPPWRRPWATPTATASPPRGDTGEDARAPGCTTTFSIADRHGNVVNVTQTLLSIFGSHVLSPTTGMMMNNGIMWFDPEPGRPNSLAPGKACLMNVCPTVGRHAGRTFALGASGGRKILPAITNLISFLTDYGMTLEQAIHHPRIDASGPAQITADETLDPGILDALRAIAPTATARRTVHPYAFAVPAAILREDATGRACGATEVMTPWGDAVPEAAMRG